MSFAQGNSLESTIGRRRGHKMRRVNLKQATSEKAIAQHSLCYTSAMTSTSTRILRKPQPMVVRTG